MLTLVLTQAFSLWPIRSVGSFAGPQHTEKAAAELETDITVQSSTLPTYPAGVSLPDQWIPGLGH